MYKKTSESRHYLPRKGSYSTVPHRNGRVEVLPPGAGMALYDVAQQLIDAKDRLEQLQKEREDVAGLIHSLGLVDKMRSRLGSGGSEKNRIDELNSERRRIERETQSVKNTIKELNAALGGGGSVEQIFMRIAELELPADVFSALASKAHSIFDKARK